ncbi:hypothetical protein ACWC5C_03455 [Streptomyces sp. NPDC001700]
MTADTAPDETPETTEQAVQSADQTERALPSLDELDAVADMLGKGIQAHLADLRNLNKGVTSA